MSDFNYYQAGFQPEQEAEAQAIIPPVLASAEQEAEAQAITLPALASAEESPPYITAREHLWPMIDIEAEIISNEAAERNSVFKGFERLFRTIGK
jgi:hypothetical protein